MSELKHLPKTTNKLNKEVNTIVKQVVTEKDPTKVKDLTDLFIASMQKKNMVRLTKLNELLDKTTDQALERFEQQPDQFSNKELIEYMNAVSNISDKAFNSLKTTESSSAMQLQQNNVNITIENSEVKNLTRESRMKILDVVDSFLQEVKEPDIIEGEVKQVDEFKTTQEN